MRLIDADYVLSLADGLDRQAKASEQDTAYILTLGASSIRRAVQLTPDAGGEAEWIVRNAKDGKTTLHTVYMCSKCERTNGRVQKPFCPNCGSIMRKKETRK